MSALPSRRLWAVAGVMFGVVVALYTTRFDHSPPYLAHDEVLLALNAESIAATGRSTDGRFLPLFFSDSALGAYGREPVSIYATALVVKLLRHDQYAVRLASALAGLLNVALMFAVARRYFGDGRSGTAAAMLLAITPVHFFYSRVGVEVVFMLPFILVWMYFAMQLTERMAPASGSNSVQRSFSRPAHLAALALALSVYAYKAAQLVAPLFLLLTLLLVARQPAPARRRMAVIASALAAFTAIVLPYVLVSAQTTRYAKFSGAYSVGDPDNSFAGNLRDVLGGEGLAARVSAYSDSFHPRLLFIAGDGSWTDSTRAAGMFLMPVVVPLLIGIYASLVRQPRHRWWLIAGFLIGAFPSLVMGEATARRMMALVPFAILLAVEGFRVLSVRALPWRAAAALIGVATLGHFAVYYVDYVTRFPERSYKYWELNLTGAFERLSQVDEARGRHDRALVVVESVYSRDYARFVLGHRGNLGLLDRLTFARLASTPVTVPAEVTLLMRQLADQSPADACPTADGWRVTAIVSEVTGEPGFVVCERGSATISGFGPPGSCHWRSRPAWLRNPHGFQWRMEHRRADTA